MTDTTGDPVSHPASDLLDRWLAHHRQQSAVVVPAAAAAVGTMIEPAPRHRPFASDPGRAVLEALAALLPDAAPAEAPRAPSPDPRTLGVAADAPSEVTDRKVAVPPHPATSRPPTHGASAAELPAALRPGS